MSKKEVKKMNNQWRMCGYLIFEEKGKLHWKRWSDYHRQMFGEKHLTEVTGRAYALSYIVLEILPYETMTVSEYTSFQKAESFLRTLPRWNRTEYLTELEQPLALRGWFNCKTGQRDRFDYDRNEGLPNIKFTDGGEGNNWRKKMKRRRISSLENDKF